MDQVGIRTAAEVTAKIARPSVKVSRRVVFDSVDIQLRLIEPYPRRTDCLVVTFQCKNNRQALDLPGFGQRFFAKHRVPALHVTVSSNHWYQTQTMHAALRAAAGVGASFDRIVAYGSSMGAFAALTFSDAVEADAVVALSPLYSIDARQVPFDNRYVGDMAGRAFLFDMASGSRRRADAYVFYDPFSQDARHAELTATCFDAAHLVPVPFAGHPCGRLLAEAGLLSRTVLGLVRGEPFDAQALRTALRQQRSRSPSYWNGMAKALMLRPHRSAEAALAAAGRAVGLAPQDGTKLLCYGLALSRAGRHDRAIEIARTVVGRMPDRAAAHSALAMVYRRASEPDLALDAIDQAITLAPNWKPYRRLRDTLSAHLERHARALIATLRFELARLKRGRSGVSDEERGGRIKQLKLAIEALETERAATRETSVDERVAAALPQAGLLEQPADPPRQPDVQPGPARLRHRPSAGVLGRVPGQQDGGGREPAGAALSRQRNGSSAVEIGWAHGATDLVEAFFQGGIDRAETVDTDT